MKIGTNTYSGICYGPIHSRRLGTSLGVNLMPEHRKVCSFNCVYCECGWNENTKDLHEEMPSREAVRQALETALSEQGDTLDVITFSGNGEPTIHPDFNGIIRDTCMLRDKYCPKAKVTVLSNSTQLGREEVVEALRLCDNRILKMDAASDEMMRRIDLPVSKDFNIEVLKGWLRQFDGDFTLQTCFLRGEMNGKTIDNTTPEELKLWYEAIDELKPKQVMIYVIDRKTPLDTLIKISADEMEQIAAPLRAKGYEVSVSA